MWFVILEISELILVSFAVFLYAFCFSCLRLCFGVAWLGPPGWVSASWCIESGSSKDEFMFSSWGESETLSGLIRGVLCLTRLVVVLTGVDVSSRFSSFWVESWTWLIWSSVVRRISFQLAVVFGCRWSFQVHPLCLEVEFGSGAILV